MYSYLLNALPSFFWTMTRSFLLGRIVLALAARQTTHDDFLISANSVLIQFVKFMTVSDSELLAITTVCLLYGKISQLLSTVLAISLSKSFLQRIISAATLDETPNATLVLSLAILLDKRMKLSSLSAMSPMAPALARSECTLSIHWLDSTIFQTKFGIGLCWKPPQLVLTFSHWPISHHLLAYLAANSSAFLMLRSLA